MQAEEKDLYLGDEAYNNRGFLKLSHFIEKADIIDYDSY